MKKTILIVLTISISFCFGYAFKSTLANQANDKGAIKKVTGIGGIFFKCMLWFTLAEQALQILPLFFAAHVVSLAVRMLAGGMFPGWAVFLAPLWEAMLWPLATLLLLAPQRRAPDPDQNRPI